MCILVYNSVICWFAIIVCGKVCGNSSMCKFQYIIVLTSRIRLLTVFTLIDLDVCLWGLTGGKGFCTSGSTWNGFRTTATNTRCALCSSILLYTSECIFSYIFSPTTSTTTSTIGSSGPEDDANSRHEKIIENRTAEKQADAHVSSHFHPFNTLPLLRSHLQPRFVIFNARAKLALLKYEWVEWIAQHYPWILRMLTLYNAWVRSLEKTQKGDPSFRYNEKDNDNDDNDDTIDYSEWPKSRQYVRKKRKAQAQMKSRSRKRKAAGSTRKVLSSKASLSTHNLSTHYQLLGKAGRSDDRQIHKWSLTLCNLNREDIRSL